MASQKLTSLLLPSSGNRDIVYSPLSETEGSLLPEKPLSEEEMVNHNNEPRSPKYKISAPWIISTLFFACLSLVFWLQLPSNSGRGSFEKGFATELANARGSIEIEYVKFSGSPSFGKDGHEFVPELTGQPRYVGLPSPEVDEAWDILTWGRYIILSEAEAKEAWGDNYRDFWHKRAGGYVAGLDMMHTLHCLDHIRQAFYPDYYPQTSLHGIMHRDHCIDHLRQMVQCYGDATPIPTRFFEGIDQNYIDSDRTHTCRSFSKLRNWTTERHNGSTAVKPYPGE